MGGCRMGGCGMGGCEKWEDAEWEDVEWEVWNGMGSVEWEVWEDLESQDAHIHAYCVRAEIVDLNFFSSAVSLLSRALWAITSSCRLQGTC